MLKACIFDLDGTLTDTLESLTYSVNKTLRELALGTISSDECRRFVGYGAQVLLEESLKAAGDVKLSKIVEASEAYRRIFGENCTYKVRPYKGILPLLEALKEQELKLGVLSNKPHQQAVEVVNGVLGEHFFCHIQGQSEELPRKPDPAGTHFVAERLGVQPAECMYIGDSEVDIQTGIAAGMITVGVSWGFRPREVLEEAGAVYIMNSPDELLEFISHSKYK